MIEFGVILIVAAGLGVIAKLLKQPLILAYILAGVLIGPLAFGVIKDQKIIENFATIGTVLLLFLVGLEINPKKMLEIGVSATIVSIGQIIISGTIYWIAAKSFGFSGSGAIFMALAFSFCSTAIIVTLLSSRNELDSLHGKLIVGILLVQDFIAILVLTLISSMGNGVGDSSTAIVVGKTIVRMLVLFSLSGIVSYYILPAAFTRIAKSHELLFITSLAWCFILVIVSSSMGLSPEIGAFLAGITIAPLPYSHHIASKTGPLRDFFLMIFFIYLGTSLAFDNINQIILPALLMSALILLVNPLVIMLIMGSLGFRKRTSFLAGLTLTQISEFSFIVVVLGAKMGVLPVEASTLTSLVALITVFFSTYLISASKMIYHKIRPLLGWVESTKRRDSLSNIDQDLKDHVILLGCNRLGGGVFEKILEEKIPAVVVDFDPKKIKKLIDENQNCVYGDATDYDIVKELNVKKANMVISTIENLEENKMVLRIYRKDNPKLKIILTAFDDEDASELYQLGADLVIVPTSISSDFMSFVLDKIFSGRIKLEALKEKSIEALEDHKIVELEKKFVQKSTN